MRYDPSLKVIFSLSPLDVRPSRFQVDMLKLSPGVWLFSGNSAEVDCVSVNAEFPVEQQHTPGGWYSISANREGTGLLLDWVFLLGFSLFWRDVGYLLSSLFSLVPSLSLLLGFALLSGLVSSSLLHILAWVRGLGLWFGSYAYS